MRSVLVNRRSAYLRRASRARPAAGIPPHRPVRRTVRLAARRLAGKTPPPTAAVVTPPAETPAKTVDSARRGTRGALSPARAARGRAPASPPITRHRRLLDGRTTFDAQFRPVEIKPAYAYRLISDLRYRGVVRGARAWPTTPAERSARRLVPTRHLHHA